MLIWEKLEDIEAERPNLGQNISVEAYRAMQYAIRHIY
jgi:hypothetical protein